MHLLGDSKLTKIGVFYDGNYFAHVSNYYNYHHPRKQRLSIAGLHDFIRHRVAQDEGVDLRFCQIVDAHYFRGRMSAMEAQSKGTLFNERVFDHVLMNEGVVTHYLPMGHVGEKGIDVWLALEVFEQTLFKRFNVVVLVVCDSDYVPLVRKLNALGVRVMVLGWDFRISMEGAEDRVTVTSQRLMNEVTYPVMMHSLIDEKSRIRDPLIANLFVPSRGEARNGDRELVPVEPDDVELGERLEGVIKAMKNGYGFIRDEDSGQDYFFYWSDCEDDFNQLQAGQEVSFVVAQNDRGLCAKDVTLLSGSVPSIP